MEITVETEAVNGHVMETSEILTTGLPMWVPRSAQNYLAHTEAGLSIRALARLTGLHASTVMRQIRKIETRRDDPLYDGAIRKLGAEISPDARGSAHVQKDTDMTVKVASRAMPESDTLDRDAIRVLRRLCEKGAVLAVAADMEKAVVVREGDAGASQRTAVVDRDLAERLALKEWIAAKQAGRITRYRITAAGRTVLEQSMGPETQGLDETPGFEEGQAPFAGEPREWGEKRIADPETGRPKVYRYNLGESPLTALARRRGKDGAPFLSDDLVGAGERLREDFELAQMGPRVTQNWDRFLTAGARGGMVPDSGVGNGPDAARGRVADALAALGPGLGDVALRCCCYLEGLEAAEKRLGWSARSGKIVLRIALQQLKRHYETTYGPGGGLIG